MKKRWKQLLNPERFRESKSGGNKFDHRNPFENDYSRMIVSPHVRRLQDKAQVFPFDKSDFVRTRLTHSLEASTFGRGLGVGIEKELIKKGLLDQAFQGHLSSILSVAGLIHDIGNPPFGHFGEETIQKYFKSHYRQYFSDFNRDERKDIEHFDGNVQGFRILLKLGLSKDKYSYNLTKPVIACIVKYPCSSREGNIDNKDQISRKKYGYLQSEKENFQNINDVLDLKGKRHPLAFLLEVADDIAYSVSDIEDGARKNIITKEMIMDYAKKYLKDSPCQELLPEFSNYAKLVRKHDPVSFDLFVQKIRIMAQGYMLIEATKTFLDNHEDILAGEFDKEILAVSKAAKLREYFKELGNFNFKHKSVLKNELIGETSLTYLLDNLIEAVYSPNNHKPRTKESKVMALISANYKNVYKNEKYGKDSYKKLLLITDYISGMTDSFAIDLYHELSGQKK